MSASPERPDDQPNSLENTRNVITKKNLSFWGLIAVCMIAGIILSSQGPQKNRIAPLAPSLLFGISMSLLVYYALGGIQNTQDNNIEADLGGIRLKMVGSVAVLLGSTMLFNSTLDDHMRPKKIALKLGKDTLLNKDDLLVLDREGKANIVNVSVEEAPDITDAVPTDQEKLNKNLMEIKETCREGQGFCAEKPREASIKVESRLKKEYVKLCSNDPWGGYPLIIRDIEGRKFSKVTAIANNNCNAQEGNRSLIEISQEVKDELGVNNNDIVYISIPPLKIPLPNEGIYK